MAQRPLKIQTKEKEGRITTKGRRMLSREEFALPPGPEEQRRGIKGRMPVDTLARARNALAVAHGAHGVRLSAAEHEAVHRAVRRKYPELYRRHIERQHSRKEKR